MKKAAKEKRPEGIREIEAFGRALVERLAPARLLACTSTGQPVLEVASPNGGQGHSHRAAAHGAELARTCREAGRRWRAETPASIIMQFAQAWLLVVHDAEFALLLELEGADGGRKKEADRLAEALTTLLTSLHEELL